jgi:hypothetical protein
METAMPKTTPPVPGMTDTLEFVKNLWGGMNVPGAAMPGMGSPTLSTDDLDKRIADLKAVETWLQMNATMLRGTIQALEVQRGTIATLKSMSENIAQAMGQGGSQAPMGTPFAQFFGAAGPGQPGPASTAAPSPAPSAPPAGASAGTGTGAAEPPMAAAMPAAMAWWNLLQDQFQQAVAGALTPDAGAATGASAPTPAGQQAAGQPPAPDGHASAQPGNGKSRPPRSGPAKS